MEYLNERMGMAVGRLFIRENFDEKSKETALEMIHNIRHAFNEILEATDWMDDETKAVAKEKVGKRFQNDKTCQKYYSLYRKSVVE